MLDPSPEDKPPRRIRYRGANPRRFAEKYKELQPERYPDDVAKVTAGGKTAAGTHRPIMVQEILDVLTPRPGELAIDCTLGYGGHAQAVLSAIQPFGKLIALDVDPIEGPKTEARLLALGYPEGSLSVRRKNFAGLAGLAATEAVGGVDLIVADLGLSSMQIDDPTRGFTFKADGPLDMRMDPTKGQPASVLLASVSEAALARIFVENADEPRADAIAAAIIRARSRTPLESTRALAQVVRTASSSCTAEETNIAIRRVFQAIRIAVNNEFAALDALLHAIPLCLRAEGRVAVLSFHSGEDRRVKFAFKQGLQEGIYKTIATEVIRASAQERRANPRSSSAKLRFAVRSSKN